MRTQIRRHSRKLFAGKTIQDGKTISQTLDLSGKEKHHFIVYKIRSDRRPNRKKLGLSGGRAERQEDDRNTQSQRPSMSPADKADRRSYPIGNQVKGRKECGRGAMS